MLIRTFFPPLTILVSYSHEGLIIQLKWRLYNIWFWYLCFGLCSNMLSTLSERTDSLCHTVAGLIQPLEAENITLYECVHIPAHIVHMLEGSRGGSSQASRNEQMTMHESCISSVCKYCVHIFMTWLPMSDTDSIADLFFRVQSCGLLWNIWVEDQPWTWYDYIKTKTVTNFICRLLWLKTCETS